MGKARTQANKRLQLQAVADEIAAPPRPGLTLVSLSCLVVEMADQYMAHDHVEESRSLIELTMSILHTARSLDRDLGRAYTMAQSRLQSSVDMIRARKLPGLDHGNTDDPEERWPQNVL